MLTAAKLVQMVRCSGGAGGEQQLRRSTDDALVHAMHVRHAAPLPRDCRSCCPVPCTPPGLGCVLQMNYQNKDALVGAMIIAGFDKHEGGQVFGCPISGTLSKEKWAIDGSGSTYIWGYCGDSFR